MPSTVNDVVRAARELEDAKTAVEVLRNRKNNAQAEIDSINGHLPAARARLAAAKAALAGVVTDFDPTQ